jgi:hypothetical protein
MLVTKSGDNFCFSLAAFAFAVLGAVFIFGRINIYDPITKGVCLKRKGNCLSGELLTTSGAVNYIVVATCNGTSGFGAVFYNSLASALGKCCTANVTIVIVIVVSTLGHLLTAPITVVIVWRNVYTVRILNAAKIAEVVLIVISALGKCSATEVALVVVVIVSAIACRLEADVTFVVSVIVCTLGHGSAAPVTCVILGRIDVDTVRILYAAPVAEVVVIIVCALGHNVATYIALMVLVSVNALGGGETANIALVIARIFVYTGCECHTASSAVVSAVLALMTE